MATQFGTSSPDSLLGTQGADTLYGWDAATHLWDVGPRSDRDTLSGLAGPDSLRGGNGGDWLFGGNHNDALDGGAGKDRLFGGLGDDVLMADEADRADGGQGNDRIYSFGPDLAGVVLRGGAGDDLVFCENPVGAKFSGGAGNDLLALLLDSLVEGVRLSLADPLAVQVLPGGTSISGFEQIDLRLSWQTGNDRIIGGDLGDTINAGLGRDVIIGRGGDDRLTVGGPEATVLGGAGNDMIIGTAEGIGPRDTLLDGGVGQDLLELDRFGSSVNIVLSLAAPDATQNIGDGTRITGFERINLVAGDGDDTITGGALDDDIDSFGGNDILFGGGGGDLLHGGDGENLVHGDAGNDTLVGAGTLHGDAGDDLFVEVPDTVGTHVLGGAGIDTLELSSPYPATLGYRLNFSTPSVAQVTAYGMTIIAVERVDFHGTSLADRVTGGAFADTLIGHDGNDILRGGAGDDHFEYHVGEGADRMFGDVGIDSLLLWGNNAVGETFSLADPLLVQTLSSGAQISGIDVLEFYGGEGNDAIRGGAFADSIQSGDGQDLLSGGGGNDMLEAWGAGSTLNGGAGNDEINGTVGAGSVFNGGAGIDTLYLDPAFADLGAIFLDLSDPTVVQTLSDGTEITGFESWDLTLGNASDHLIGGAFDDRFTTWGGNDTFSGGDGNDSLIAWSGTMRFYGGAGNDQLSAAKGDDLLFGGAGNDNLSGGGGSDLLVGGLGRDTLSGGDGADRYQFKTAPTAMDADLLIFNGDQGDRIELLGEAFGGLATGALDPGAFVLGRKAADADDRLIWDAARGLLCFDADGKGGQAKVILAFLLMGTDLSAADILIL